jgi:hypothetical protein
MIVIAMVVDVSDPSPRFQPRQHPQETTPWLPWPMPWQMGGRAQRQRQREVRESGRVYSGAVPSVPAAKASVAAEDKAAL